jgi:hypothetical protein
MARLFLLSKPEMDSESSDSNADKNLSTRVNAARLPEYIGRHVRLACKVLKVRVLPPYLVPV